MEEKLISCPRCAHILMVGSSYPELREYKDELVYYEHDCGFLTQGAETEEEAREHWNNKNFNKEFFNNLYSWEKTFGVGWSSPLKKQGEVD